jgi:hypothetical protein
MKLSKAIKICLDYHRNHSKPNTVRSYEAILTKLDLTFGEKELQKFIVNRNCYWLTDDIPSGEYRSPSTRSAN